ncbi:MAG: D-2-hydroxyacid dehydrogenase [FCB group bacterium]|nr:D-2-hydroxyacid dehydrogenase [FCB group bacterium]
MKIVSHTTKDPQKRDFLRKGVERILGDSAEVVFLDPGDDPQEVLRGAEILLTYTFQPEWWQGCDSLKWVHAGGAGINHLGFPELVTSAVTITNSRGIHARTMSEYVLGAMLHYSQIVPQALLWKQNRDWKAAKTAMTRESYTLRGKKAGIVGGGAIGTAVRDLCMQMEMGVFVIHRKRRGSETPWKVRNGDMGDLDALMEWSDFVVVCLPLTNVTRRCIGRRQIGLMKKTGVLINIARGGLVDETALAEALHAEQIGGACLDVFEEEPLPVDSTLFDCPNLLMTPHAAGNYPEYVHDVIRLFLDNLERYAGGKALKNVVDWERGY